MARPKKQKELCRGKRVHVRYSDTEYELISSHAKDLGCPISTFVRRCTLNEKLTVHYNVVADIAELRDFAR